MSLWKECVLAIALILFSNYYALFCNVYYVRSLFLENNILTEDSQRENSVCTFHLKLSNMKT